MRKLLYIALTFLLLASCAGQRRYDAALRRAQAILNDAPDSALAILDSLESSSQDFSQSNLRRWQLLRLSAQNKCDTVFRSDSLQLILTDYYDRHGTSNERMTAYYLLGRAYSDMGEAPQALRSYQKAAECADTSSNKCDWRQLTFVYLQAGNLFFRQYLPNEAISFFTEAERMALKSDDKTLYLNAAEQKILAYHELSDVHRIDSITCLVHQGYDEMGETEKASRSLATSLYYHIKAGDAVKAREQINYILKHIGKDKIISTPEWASFNSYIGNYYLLIGKTDSAEFHFRTMLLNNDQLQIKVFAYHGLLDVYQMKGNPDSVFKYAKAYSQVNDSSNIFHYSRQLENINSLYRFDRLEKNMILSKASSQRKNFIIIIILLASAALLASAYYYFKYRQMLSKRELVLQTNRYNDLAQMYYSLSQDMDAMKAEKFDVVSTLIEKEKLLAALEKQMKEHDAVICHHSTGDPETSKIFMDLHKKAISGKKATTNELQTMRNIVSEKAASFTEGLKSKNYMMDFREENICYMIRFGFSASEISVLLGLSPQTLSYYKRKLLKKLFSINGKASELNNFLCKI